MYEVWFLKSKKWGGLLPHLCKAIGGIHEVYFPFILMNPLLIIAPILGGATGTFIFQMSKVGLRSPASPGSILVICNKYAKSHVVRRISWSIGKARLFLFCCLFCF